MNNQPQMGEESWRFALWDGERIVPRAKLAADIVEDIVEDYKREITENEERVVEDQKKRKSGS